MKLSDFLKGIFGPKIDQANSGITAVKEAADNKNFSGVLGGVQEIVAAGAQIVEQASNDLKALTGGGIPGQEKHDMVKNLVLDAVEPSINKVVPVPSGTTQEFWGGFLRQVLGGVVSILINSFVARANEKNWKF